MKLMTQGLDFQAAAQGADRAAAAAERMQRLAKTQGGVDKAKIRQAAEDFEGLFLGQMLEHLFSGLETNEMFGGGDAEDIYKSMMMEEYGKMMAKSGGIGVASHVMRQMLQQQEISSNEKTVNQAPTLPLREITQNKLQSSAVER